MEKFYLFIFSILQSQESANTEEPKKKRNAIGSIHWYFDLPTIITKNIDVKLQTSNIDSRL